MPSWEERNAASISAFDAAGIVMGDVGNTYQRFLFGNATPRSQGMAQPSMGSTVNPEYLRAEEAYIAQEEDRARMDGITVDDYQSSNIDWDAYGHMRDNVNYRPLVGLAPERESYGGIAPMKLDSPLVGLDPQEPDFER